MPTERRDGAEAQTVGQGEVFDALLIVTPGINMLTLTSLVDGMRAANRMSGARLFDWRIATVDGRAIEASNGFPVPADLALAAAPLSPNVFVLGSYEPPSAIARPIVRFLRRAARHGCSLAGIDQGTPILAAAGLLDGYRATTHWEVIPPLSERYPKVEFVEQIFVIDRDRVTCAGHTTCIDLLLHMMVTLHGRSLALAVAREMIHGRLRSGQERQRLLDPGLIGTSSRHLDRAIALMRDHLAEPVRIERIASMVGLSLRQLESQFRSRLKSTPLRYYLSLRLSLARELLLYSSMRIGEVSSACGFSSQAGFTRAFQREFGVTPTGYRQNFRRSLDRPYVFDFLLTADQPARLGQARFNPGERTARRPGSRRPNPRSPRRRT